jgi:hypothetical protein
MSTGVVTIFISHISEERELADLLKQRLVSDFRKRIRVFVSSDLESINAGDEWLKSIKTALNRAKVELILCSRLSITRPWVNFEVGAAWLRKIPIVPVCHSGLQVGDLPVPYNAWNGIEAGEERDLEKLYKSIAKSAGVKSPAVDFAAFATAVQGFESTYAVNVRMRGKGGALVDLNQADRLVGTWKGQGADIEIPKTLKYKTKFTYELTLNLQRRQGLISGTFTVHTFQRDRTDTAFIDLINVSGEYFYFKYWVAIPQANHCGFMLMQLSIAGDELEGIFLTNKLFERQIGLGKLLFRREG